MDGFIEGDAVHRLRPNFPSLGHALGPSPWLRKVGLHWQHGRKSAPYTRARRAEEVRTRVRELPRSAHHQQRATGCSSAWLEHSPWAREAARSNRATPTGSSQAGSRLRAFDMYGSRARTAMTKR